jgi:hypothetical protein
MALKPPLGFHPIYSPRPLWWRVRYYLRKAVWKGECLAFERWGQGMRDGWEKLKPNKPLEQRAKDASTTP